MLDVASYVPTDPFFGTPFIDSDEERDLPIPHRRVHGGFEGTDTRFRFYFPEASRYHGRAFTPLSGGNGGTEDFFGNTDLGEMIGGLSMCIRLGGYMVESNQGHIGDVFDPKGGEDPTLYGYRASAESTRFSKFLAAQIYGTPPHHAYVFGGSGGGRRSPLCLENAPDAWDGALPFMGGGDVAEPGNTKLLKGSQARMFSTMFNVQRLLRGGKLDSVIDAMTPGGSGDPYEGLTTHEREELAALYQLGFPRGDELMIGEQMGQAWLWCSEGDLLYARDREYFENFWTKPGYIGHDFPQLVSHDLTDARLTISRVITARELIEQHFTSPELASMAAILQAMAEQTGGMETPFGVEIPGVGTGYRFGAGLRLLNGKAVGRQLYTMASVGDVFFCDGAGEAGNLRFTDVLPGDEVHVDNRNFLAYCYYARHHVFDEPQFDFLKVDGRPIHVQHEIPDMTSFMGTCYSGQYKGKLMWVHHTHDASLWPSQGITYDRATLAAQGEAGWRERFRVRWTENCEHVPPQVLPSKPNRATNTWLIDYQPVIEQSLQDLADWVERGIEPEGTAYEYGDGKVTLPPTARERGGIQPVVRVSANDGVRAEVRTGEPVTLSVHAEVPPKAGTIVSIEWDFAGSGTFPFSQPGVDGTASELTLSTTHSYDRPGTYFATARVCSHREGDVKATARRIPNVAQARIVVG